MESVYLETTLISYLVARPSRDLLIAAHQQATRDWWAERRESFECYVSQVVIDEVSGGDPEEAKTRLTIISSFPVLEVTEEAEFLAEAIVSGGVIPRRAVRDAAHIAIAAVNGMYYPHSCIKLARIFLKPRWGKAYAVIALFLWFPPRVLSCRALAGGHPVFTDPHGCQPSWHGSRIAKKLFATLGIILWLTLAFCQGVVQNLDNLF